MNIPEDKFYRGYCTYMNMKIDKVLYVNIYMFVYMYMYIYMNIHLNMHMCEVCN